ncbi:MAG: argininosuccinate synthase [Flavobacteriaceae bacterium TMED184]|nr:MAG: argininosuccinate synthase [Flavobacteriaceae bacterium TMED184]
MKKIVLAYSGGLDTSYCLKTFAEDQYEVHAITIDTGGFSEVEKNNIKKRAILIGAKKYISIKSKQSYYEQIIKYLIYGNVLRNNNYPLSVSAERIIQAIEIIKYAKKNKIKKIAHGSTGAGNDQVRFDMIFQILAPEIKIITPIRDGNISRKEEINFLVQKGVKIKWSEAKYSINRGLWGTTIGGDETLTSNKSLPETAFLKISPKNDFKKISLTFYQGEVFKINGEKMTPIKIIEKISSLCAEYGIGRDIHVGDTIIGIKGRVGFEAGGPLVIIKSHHLLEKHTLTKWQQFQKEQISSFYGMLLHEGQFLDPVVRDIEAFLKSSQKNVSGEVLITLYPKRFELEGINSKNDLMSSRFASYGESNTKWDAEDVKGFIKIISNQNKIFQYVHSKK